MSNNSEEERVRDLQEELEEDEKKKEILNKVMSAF